MGKTGSDKTKKKKTVSVRNILPLAVGSLERRAVLDAHHLPRRVRAQNTGPRTPKFGSSRLRGAASCGLALLLEVLRAGPCSHCHFRRLPCRSPMKYARPIAEITSKNAARSTTVRTVTASSPSDAVEKRKPQTIKTANTPRPK